MADSFNASTELIPIQIKEALSRDTFPSRPSIEKYMHTTMGPGSFLDRNLGDAIAWVEDTKKELLQKVIDYANLQLAAQVAGLPPPACAPASVVAILSYIRQVKTFIQEIQDLIQSIRDLILYLASLIKRIQAYIQRQLNAIATLINEICNFHLPSLPSFPNLFGNVHFDGFKFTRGMFEFRLSFDTHFAFGNCKLRNVASNPLRDALSQYGNAKGLAINPDGSGSQTLLDTYKALFNPPLKGGALAPSDIPDSVRTDTTPWFVSTFDSTSDFIGSLPKPTSIVSAYKLPTTELHSHVLSLVGNSTATAAITLDQNAPNTPEVLPWSSYIAPTREFCRTHVTLAAIEDASQGWTTLNPADQSTTPAWAVIWSWLRFMNQCRWATPVVESFTGTTHSVYGRGGSPWIPAFQKVFGEFVGGSTLADPYYTDIHTDVPWNVVTSGPTSMVWWTKLVSLDAASRGQALWAMSYLEASLLGYPRETRWDAYAPGGSAAPVTPLAVAVGLLDGPTGSDLDYQSMAIPSVSTPVSVVLDSGGLANYPTTIEVPDYLLPTMNTVITACNESILNDPKYTSQHSKSMYVYTASATALLINSYSQFWRDFASNWADLKTKDPELTAMVFNYPAILRAALDPRSTGAPFQGVGVTADTANCYPVLIRDFADRVTPFGYHYEDPTTSTLLWAPGWPWIQNPTIPQLYLPISADSPAYGTLNDYNEPIYALPQFTDDVSTDPSLDGWERMADPDDPNAVILGKFNPTKFLARADIKALPYNEQQSLVFYNQTFDEVATTGTALLGTADQTLKRLEAQAKSADEQLAVLQSWATLSSLGHPYVLPPEDFDPSTFFGGPAVAKVPDGVVPNLMTTAASSIYGTASDGFTAPPTATPTEAGMDPTTAARYRKQILVMTPPPGVVPSKAIVNVRNPNVSPASPWLAAYGPRTVTDSGSSGGGGGTDPGTNIEFVQSTPAATWEIQHDLGKFPTVVVTDVDGMEVTGYEVDYHLRDASKISKAVTLSFNPPFAGHAFLH